MQALLDEGGGGCKGKGRRKGRVLWWWSVGGRCMSWQDHSGAAGGYLALTWREGVLTSPAPFPMQQAKRCSTTLPCSFSVVTAAM